jgi:LuxR family maltose regulon positive regulatory protein
VDDYTARLFYARGRIHQIENELAETEIAARYLADIVATGTLLESKLWANSMLGRVCYKQNRLQEALAYYAAPAEYRSATNQLVALNSAFGQALAYQALGHPEQADTAAASARRLALDVRSPLLAEMCTAFEGHLALLRGDIERAIVLTISIPLDPPRRTFAVPYNPELTKLAVLIAEGTPASLQSAESYLDKLTEFCVKNHTQDKLADLMSRRVLLEKALGRDGQALQTLQTLVDAGRPAQLIRVFVDCGKPMHELLQQYAALHPHDRYLAKILLAFEPTATPFAPTSAPVRSPSSNLAPFLPELLTDRELQILELLKLRRSDKEIAQILTISRLTVQTHTRNIYAKLGVTGRHSAVAAATELGILLPSPSL